MAGRIRPLHIGIAALLSLTASCTGEAQDTSSSVVTIEVLAHDGTDAERDVLARQVAQFNETHEEVQVQLRLVPEGDYNDTLQAAVASGDVPDLTEVDGPLLAKYAYQDVLTPLEDLLPNEVLESQLPSLQSQGTYEGRIYSAGVFDSGLGMFADRKALERAGIEWPRSVDDAWTAAEFGRVLSALAREDRDAKVLDVKQNYGVGEWLTYGFAPLVASAGGELIDPDSLSPVGRFDGDAARTALRYLREWSSFTDPNRDDDAFVTRAVALSWVGHWAYRDYAAALGEDLLVLPLPDLGNGTKTGQGSWAWTITGRDEPRRRAAATFLQYLLGEEEVLRMAEANGGVPGTSAALAGSTLYGKDGPLRLFADQLLLTCGTSAPTPSCVAVPRPVTPGYDLLSSQFAIAVSLALSGQDPDAALAEGSTFLQDDLEAHDRYR